MKSCLLLGQGPIVAALYNYLQGNKDLHFSVISSREITNFSGSSMQSQHPSSVNLADFVDSDFVIVSWKVIDDQANYFLNRLSIALPRTCIVINLSSAAVYGVGTNLQELNSRICPINGYGVTKRNIELSLENHFTGRLVNLRISNLYGSHLFDDITNRVLNSILSRKPLELLAPTLLIRDYVYLGDLVSFLADLLTGINLEDLKVIPQDVNFSTGVGTSTHTLVQNIESLLGRSLQFRTLTELAPNIISKSSLDPGLLLKYFGFSPHKLEVGMPEYLSHRLSMFD